MKMKTRMKVQMMNLVLLNFPISHLIRVRVSVCSSNCTDTFKTS